MEYVVFLCVFLKRASGEMHHYKRVADERAGQMRWKGPAARPQLPGCTTSPQGGHPIFVPQNNGKRLWL